MTQDDLNTLIALRDEIVQIMGNESFSWEQKYYLIFSDEISGKIASYVNAVFYDSNLSHQENIQGYLDSVNMKIEKLQEQMV